MTPFKEDIFRELEALLADARPEQIERLLSDIAQGTYTETSQTRAGSNDNRANVTDMIRAKGPVAIRLKSDQGLQLSAAARDVRRKRYSS
jgi:hypothetical protein